jgi:hypothetical protein
MSERFINDNQNRLDTRYKLRNIMRKIQRHIRNKYLHYIEKKNNNRRDDKRTQKKNLNESKHHHTIVVTTSQTIHIKTKHSLHNTSNSRAHACEYITHTHTQRK